MSGSPQGALPYGAQGLSQWRTRSSAAQHRGRVHHDVRARRHLHHVQPVGRRALLVHPLRPQAHRRPPLRGPGHLERRLPAPRPPARRGDDLPLLPRRDPADHPAELSADHFPATTRFYERASYGRFTLRPHPLRNWIRMPHPSTSYAIQRDWNPANRAAYLRDALAAADPEVDFSRYDVVYFVADPDAPGVDSDATKVVNLDTPLRADGTDVRRVVTVFEKHPPDRLVLAHETGHVFDLPDPLPPAGGRQGRLGHLCRRLGSDGQSTSAWPPTCSPGTSGNWAGWTHARWCAYEGPVRPG
ncbi:M6 family metalloprotease domain-containing protein [Streptomyces sp. L7]